MLAHEIAHVVVGHARSGRPPANRVASEAEADRLALRFLAAAGYDPRAQPDLQATLIAAHALDARLRGAPRPLPARSYAPGLDDRLRASRAAVRLARGGTRGRDRHLAAIDGMSWVRARRACTSACIASHPATTCSPSPPRCRSATRRAPASTS